MVEDPMKSISEYRTSTLYKNLSFAGNKSEKHSAVRESVVATYLSINKLLSQFLRNGKSYLYKSGIKTPSVRRANPGHPVSYKYTVTKFFINVVFFYNPAVHNA